MNCARKEKRLTIWLRCKVSNPARVRSVFEIMKIFACCIFAVALSVSPVVAQEPAPTKWNINGVQREALIFLPRTSGKTKVPVIFAFHGHGGNMRFAARGMAFQNFWPEAIVVYPQGLPTPGTILDQKGEKPGWQRGPGQEHDRDLKFVDVMIATLREKYSADDRRIYATGFSNGGLFTYLLWSQRADQFAAFAPGGAVLLPSVELTQPRPVLHFGGERDRLARFSKQQETIEKIRTFNQCVTQGESCGGHCTIYSSSKSAPLKTFIHPFGHIYPPPVTPIIIKFFQEHPRNS
jgi:polyhydroxybutyrate depolymerase